MLILPAQHTGVHQWSLTLHGPGGILSQSDSQEAQFYLGTDEASDVVTVSGEGIAPRHAWVWISDGLMQVENLAGETFVNGHPIEGRVETVYPASVQVGEVTLLVELKREVPDISINVTIPERIPSRPVSSTDVTIPQRKQTRGGNDFGNQKPAAGATGKAPLGGEYILVKEIARGGMGQIYFGEDPQLGRQVAVKVSSLSEGGEDARFSKEAKVLAQLAHPNIVPIHAIGVDSQGRPFYSMKLVKGRTLQAVLSAIGKGDAAAIREYPLAALLTIFRKVCDAMAFAHAKGVLHRDLKPENIMVGEYGEVLVMDWGLAKVLGGKDDVVSGWSPAKDTGDYGMTMEGEVMGTPQYMSPEQAEGMVAELDARSDIYSLGGVLYAILTLRPPIEGTTLNEVLTKVKNGEIGSMIAKRMVKAELTAGTPSAMDVKVPEALQAVTLKAMSTERTKRYPSVEAFAGDIEAYQNGFATSAEEAGTLKKVKLWVGRNKVLAGSVLVLSLVVAGFTVRVVQKGREANMALQSLRETAPTFAIRASDALQDGQFDEALEAATFAVSLQPGKGEYQALRGNVLQVLVRWPEAVEAYQAAVHLGDGESVKANLKLTEDLIVCLKNEGATKAKGLLFEALTAQGRQGEAMAFGKELGDFWKNRKKDLTALPELVKRLEAKLLPVPGTKVLMSRTEFTVGEWKLYLQAEGLPGWTQPASDWVQNDEHPVVNVNWNQVKAFCEWLSEKTGKEWRLPTNDEWTAAAGGAAYPWGEYYPPNWDDGNYAVLPNGRADPKRVGMDGILGTAPVASFKANSLGFYDLGGNAAEWVWDEFDKQLAKSKKNWNRCFRGASWESAQDSAAARGVLRKDHVLSTCRVSDVANRDPSISKDYVGFRVVRM